MNKCKTHSLGRKSTAGTVAGQEGIAVADGKWKKQTKLLQDLIRDTFKSERMPLNLNISISSSLLCDCNVDLYANISNIIPL